jgi:putative chitinase
MVTRDILSVLAPTNKNIDIWVEAMNTILPKYDIVTPKRLAAFLAQTAHESAGFTAVRENLNYSAQGLMNTWPTRFNQTTAAAYARQPEKIANKVYANRMGNGDEASGDG